jgi:hypothetical protein
VQQLPRRQVLGSGNRLGSLFVAFEETRVKGVDEWVVQPVEPHHDPVAGMGVIVPVPAGGEEEVARSHGHALAVHRGVGAIASDDEPERCGGVSVGLRGLPRHEDLDPGEEGVDSGRWLGQRWIDQHQHAALRLDHRQCLTEVQRVRT